MLGTRRSPGEDLDGDSDGTQARQLVLDVGDDGWLLEVNGHRVRVLKRNLGPHKSFLLN
jgi:hypothetical protein